MSHPPTSPTKPTKGRAPRTLTITQDAKVEEEFELRARRIRRDLDMGEMKMEALEIIRKQVHDLGELEERMSEANQQLLRRHIIAWKAGVAVRRRKMQKHVTDIPIAATGQRSHPISKCERRNRRCRLCCCAKAREEMDADCTRPDSVDRFLRESQQMEAVPSMTSNAYKAYLRRQQIFDPVAPAYLVATPGTTDFTRPNRLSSHTSDSQSSSLTTSTPSSHVRKLPFENTQPSAM